MNWFRQNQFLGAFLLIFALLTLGALTFLLHEKSAADDQATRLETTNAELQRLRGSRPFPNGANLRKMKVQTESYRRSLGALATELKTRALPLVPLEPNEFQARLRETVNAVIAEASAKKVELPQNFYLGFEDYANSLPNSTAAPLLGRELKAVAILANAAVAAHVDALSNLTRTPLREEKPAPTPTPTPSRARGRLPASTAKPPTLVRAQPIQIAFAASPSATRKFLNQIVSVQEQLFIIRSLVVKNEQEKGPKRGAVAPPVPAAPPNAAAGTAAAIRFIVGNEHLKVSAWIDIINVDEGAKEVR